MPCAAGCTCTCVHELDAYLAYLPYLLPCGMGSHPSLFSRLHTPPPPPSSLAHIHMLPCYAVCRYCTRNGRTTPSHPCFAPAVHPGSAHAHCTSIARQSVRQAEVEAWSTKQAMCAGDLPPSTCICSCHVPYHLGTACSVPLTPPRIPLHSAPCTMFLPWGNSPGGPQRILV